VFRDANEFITLFWWCYWIIHKSSYMSAHKDDVTQNDFVIIYPRDLHSICWVEWCSWMGHLEWWCCKKTQNNWWCFRRI